MHIMISLLYTIHHNILVIINRPPGPITKLYNSECFTGRTLYSHTYRLYLIYLVYKQLSRTVFIISILYSYSFNIFTTM
jgi:hypothetical protein